MPNTLKVGVIISGRGSNLQSLLAATAAPGFPAQIVTVLSNRPAAGGLAHARAAGVPGEVVDHKAYTRREDFEAALTASLERAAVDLVCLAGFMRVVTPGFVRHWQGRMINIHPSLLPSFPGLDTHARALAAGVKLHGCSVDRSEEHTSELQSLMRISYAVFCLKKKNTPNQQNNTQTTKTNH